MTRPCQIARPASRTLGALLACTLLSGCLASLPIGGGAGDRTPAERQLRADSERFALTVIGGTIEGVMQGCLNGILQTIGWGSARRTRDHCMRLALLTGLEQGVGAYEIAVLDQAQKDRARALTRVTADLRQDSARLQTVIASARRVQAEGRQRLQALQQEVAANRIGAADAETRSRREQDNLEILRADLAQARNTRAQYAGARQRVAAGGGSQRELDEAIERMDSQIRELQQLVDDYARSLKASRA